MTSTTPNAVRYSVTTVLGAKRELACTTGSGLDYDTGTTLNNLYNIFPAAIPATIPGLQYFGVGINGCYNADSTNIRRPYQPLPSDMGLSIPIPFRFVPTESDLTAAEMSNYRIRSLVQVGSSNYYAYWLKTATMSGGISLVETDATTGLQNPYVIDYSNLTPTRTVPTSSGNASTTTEVNAQTTMTLTINDNELLEYITAIYGDLAYAASVSELGLFSGVDQSVSVTTYGNASLTYTESMYTQLNNTITWCGDDMSSSTKNIIKSFNLVSGRVLLV